MAHVSDDDTFHLRSEDTIPLNVAYFNPGASNEKIGVGVVSDSGKRWHDSQYRYETARKRPM